MIASMSFRTVLSIAPITGDHITLRRPTVADVDTIAEYLRDDGADEWLSGSESASVLYAEYSAGWDRPDQPNRLGLTLVIAGSDDDRLVGVTHLEPDGRVLHVSLGIAPDHRRSGVASEALTLCSAWALAQGFKRVELEIGEDNLASQAVARRCSFEPTSRTRSQLLPDGELWHARAWCLRAE
jgi:RimJ/RimL family protein N-acetyltransferase